MQTSLNQYILVKITADGNKLPANYHGDVIDAHDPTFWMSYDDATRRAHDLGMRVGFVLTDSDPYFCIDIDRCLNPGGESWSDLANDICRTMAGCYMESSISGKGLHIWGRYSTPLPPRKIKNPKLGLELYHKARFICLGTYLQGSVEVDATAQACAVIDRYLQLSPEEMVQHQEWTAEPVAEWSGPADNEELLALMLKSRSLASHFGSKATFQQLWTADADALAKHYPPQSDGKVYDASSADAALAQHLAFWTGRNCDRIKGFMLASSLKRDKWDREDYLVRTILNACSRQKTVYHAGTTPDSGISERMAGGFVPPENIPGVFVDCTYIVGEHSVLVPGGAVIKPDQFKVLYGGFKFKLDDQKNTRNAWDAFTQCSNWRPPTVDGRCFRPELPPLKIVEDNGRLLVNTYIPVHINQTPGDISCFMQLLERSYPDSTDREMLLSYMAAVVQYPGRKFGWAPLLQGPEGNGKTFLTTVVAEAIGDKYCHTANAGEFTKSGSKFNSWVEGKLFIAVHDIRVKSEAEMELLKPLLTDDKIEIQGKGRDQYTGDNRANFIFTSNHMDALRLYDGGRRYAPFAAAQQTPEELIDAGLTAEFYADLWDWAKGRGKWAGDASGFSKLAHFLHNYKIKDALNPAIHATRAPRTSAWSIFIAASAGPVEQEVSEAIAQGRPGFCGGFVSSIMMDKLLEERRISKLAPLNSRTDILRRMGFVPHPHLPQGRVTTNLLPDGGRPRLYVREGHPILQLKSIPSIQQRYVQTNTGSGSLVEPPPPQVASA